MLKKMLKLLPLIALFIVFTSSKGYSQLDNPIKWTHHIEKADNQTLKLVVEASIDNKWHLYAMDSPEEGSLPLWFDIQSSKDFSLKGNFTQKTSSHEKYDDIFEVNVKFFEHNAVFEQVFVPISSDKFSIVLVIDGQACFDDGKCVMVSDELTISVNPSDFLSNSTTNSENDNTNENAEDIENTEDVNNTIEDTSTTNEVVDNIKESNQASVSEENTSSGDTTTKEENKEENKSLLGTFLLAILLGLAGILTPCVFPMIPMTVSFFMQGKGSRASGIFKALVFGFSIVLLYTLIGVIVSLTSAGADFPTMLSTHWIPNSIFFLMFIFFAGSFFGLYEIVLPSGLANKADKQVDKGGVMSAFFMAVTLVIVSFACTGPIVGALLVKAAGGSVLEPTIGMLGFGIGFGLPFTILAISPSWLSKLPQSGGWMNSVKVVMAFIILAFSLKFLSNLDQNYHLNLMSRDIYIAIWIVLFIVLGIYLLGKIKLPHDTDVKHVSVLRLFLAIISFTFALYMFPGMFGADLKPISGLIPPKSLQQFNISGGSSTHSSPTSNLCEEPKYADIMHLSEGVQGYFDYEQGMRCAEKQNKPVILYFTGHSCSNCKKMQAEIWTDTKVQEYFNNEFVFIALYIDDKYKLPEEEWVTSSTDGKVKNTIGKKNADIQITMFNINSQPFYVMLSPDGTQLGDPMEFQTDVSEFIDWMDSGIETFNSGNNIKKTDTDIDGILCSEYFTVLGEKGEYIDMEIEKYKNGKIKIVTSPSKEKDIDISKVVQGIIISDDITFKYEKISINDNLDEHWAFYANLEGTINEKQAPGSYNIKCNCKAPKGSCSLAIFEIGNYMLTFRCDPTPGDECTGNGTGSCEIEMEQIKNGASIPTMLIIKGSEIEYNGIIYQK